MTPNYFAEMDIPIMRGRTFTERDDWSAPEVAIVNEALVRRGWPRVWRSARLIEVESGGRRVKREIVGVMHDTRTTASDLTPRPELYVPFPQGTATSVNVIIDQPARSAAGLVHPGRRGGSRRDWIMSIQEELRGLCCAWLLGLFAGMALPAIAWWVTRRTRADWGADGAWCQPRRRDPDGRAARADARRLSRYRSRPRRRCRVDAATCELAVRA